MAGLDDIGNAVTQAVQSAAGGIGDIISNPPNPADLFPPAPPEGPVLENPTPGGEEPAEPPEFQEPPEPVELPDVEIG